MAIMQPTMSILVLIKDAISGRVSEIDRNHSIGGYFTILGASALDMTSLVFTISNLVSRRFWGFCYVSICIASNIRLSLSDVKGALSGFGCVVLPFLLINFFGLITGFGSEKFFPFTASSLGMVYSLLILALVMVLLGVILIYLVLAAFVKLRRGRILNPF
jgi:hypothetical protein